MEISLTEPKEQNYLASLDCTKWRRVGGELDHDEPPDGQGEGQPSGYCMDCDGEVCVEE